MESEKSENVTLQSVTNSKISVTGRLPKQKDLKKVPKDETVDAIIVDLQIKTWEEITKDETKRKNLQTPKGELLEITYDAQGFIRRETFPLNKILTTNSKYGKFCEKYNKDDDENFEPKVGMQIKVLFDSKGSSNILIAK